MTLKKVLLTILGIFILTILSIGLFVSYHVLTPDTSKAKQEVINIVPVVGEPGEMVSYGEFNYLDPFHNGTGSVSVFREAENYRIILSEDFAAAEAPDPWVYLSKPQEFIDQAYGGLDLSQTISLDPLASNTGRQEYLVSKADYEAYSGAVVIWCKKFRAQISRADLGNP